MRGLCNLYESSWNQTNNTKLTDILEETKQRTRMGEIRDEVREIQGQIRGEKEQTNQKKIV